jgi:ribosome-binding factor A
MFTITEVDVSPDIKNAKVFVSVYSTSPEKADATFNAINNAAQEIRHELAYIMRSMRYIPELRFYRDQASEYGSRIDGILSNITYGEYDDDNGDSSEN